jgi:diguanylate cyclase (GGDEF)-like protein
VLGTGAAGLAAIAAAAALVTGARLMARPRVAPGPPPVRAPHVAPHHLATALAACLWGLGQLVAATLNPVRVPGEPWWSVAVAASALAGAALLPPRTPERLGRTRLAAETVLLGSAFSLLFWNLQPPPPDTPVTGLTAVFALVVLDGALVAMLLLVAVRDRARGILLAFLGAALYAVGDAHEATEHLVGPAPDWRETVLGGVGWFVLCAGLLTRAADQYAPDPTDRQPPGELRRLVVSTALPLLVAIAATTAFTVRGLDTGAPQLALSGAFVTAALGRELVRGFQQNRLMRMLVQQAATDPMTGLGNRRALTTALEELHADPHRESNVLTIDIDGFKDINSLLGHRTGDALLVAVAAELDRQCRAAGASAFRLGGDEFAVVVAGPPEAAEALADRLLTAMPEAVATVPGTGRVDVSASIGIAHRDADGRTVPHAAEGPHEAAADATVYGTVDDLMAPLTRSGEAMRAAKAAGRARVMTYGTPMARRRSRAAAIERRLRRRIADGEGLEINLQPVISLGEMRMTGMESLARWGEDPELGAVSPAEFIPIAEDTGLILELGRQLMHRTLVTCEAVGAREAGLVTGVNVSPLQLRSPGFVRQFGDLLDELAWPPKQFVVEITESVHIEHDDPAVPAILGLADLGIVIAIDDFGAGYSSLNYLNQLPVRILKLDRSITQRLAEPRGLAIARCVTEMARELGIDVVAEGIETPEHLAAVRRISVGFGQGWLFSRAVPPERFAEFVRDPRLAIGIPVRTA